MRKKRNVKQIYVTAVVLLLLSLLAGISLGASSVGINKIIPTLLGNGTFKEEFILFSVRLPRVLVLMLAGMALALSGAILQTLTRNPLADPGIIGINAGAGLAITIFYIYVDAQMENYAFQLPFVGFVGAMLTAVLLYVFSYSRTNGVEPIKLVLMGVGFAFALSGLMVIIMSGADQADVLFVSKWLSGNIWGADWPFILAILPWLILFIPILFFKTRTMNLLTLNETVVKGLGVTIQRERVQLLIIAVALAAVSVSVVGSITFIGLLAPHIAKQLVGVKHQSFLFLSPLIGGTVLVFSDTIGRVMYSEQTIPAGIIVAVLGAPYFLFLLRKAA